jgi:hypothetical protein
MTTNTYNYLSSSTLPPRFAAACAAALGLATMSLFAMQHIPAAAPAGSQTVTLPTILVVPDASDRAAAAALGNVVAAARAKPAEGV